MKIIYFFTLLILVSSVLAQTPINDYNDVTYLEMKFTVSGSFQLIETSNSARTSEATTNLTFFPKDEINQKILSTTPSSVPSSVITKKNSTIGYFWQNPKPGEYKFSLDSNVRVNNVLVIVDKKIDFPLENVETYYTQPTEYIDINEDIKKQAQELASGEDDLYEVSIKVAEWIQKNIKYDLSTLTAESVQKSSWVLKNKEGVCDELTNLYISMMRSLGIPARYVSGMAYTNLKNDWGPHAWAEVYFPDKGWVPFDITYVQYGWIDSSHIKVKTSVDSGEPAVRYNWKSVDAEFKPSKLEVKTSLIRTGEKIGKQLEIKIKPLIKNVGPGSYVPIEVEIINDNNFYFPVTLTFLKAPELTDKNYKALVLKPGENKKIFWIATIPKKTEENFIYTSKLEAEDNFHNQAYSEITFSNDENLNIKCNIRNKGNIQLFGINVCLEEDCKEISELQISDSVYIEFILKNNNKGEKNIEIVAKTNNIEVSDIIKFEVIDSSGLEIKNFVYDSEVDYNEKTKIEMDLLVKVPVKELEVFVNDIKVSEIPELSKSKKILIMAEASEFVSSDKIKLSIKFKDKQGKQQESINEYPIKILNVPWYVKLLAFLHLL